MKTNERPTAASLKYAAAQAMHYETKDRREALELYVGVLADHPNAPEAEDSRVQIRNVVDAVVAKPMILDALVKLAMARLTRGDGELPAGSSPVEAHVHAPARASG